MIYYLHAKTTGLQSETSHLQLYVRSFALFDLVWVQLRLNDGRIITCDDKDIN